MSLPVAFSDVTERIAEYGARAALITVDADSAPHVVSVLVRTDDDRVLAEVGGRTHANLAANPKLSMLWPPLAGGQYHLIVDGLLESVTSVSD
ncbi:MAG: pyridoxamine 5'-phosphate oxidase family protein, partial [Ilumatobacteraceae bacterium]